MYVYIYVCVCVLYTIYDCKIIYYVLYIILYRLYISYIVFIYIIYILYKLYTSHSPCSFQDAVESSISEAIAERPVQRVKQLMQVSLQ